MGRTSRRSIEETQGKASRKYATSLVTTMTPGLCTQEEGRKQPGKITKIGTQNRRNLTMWGISGRQQSNQEGGPLVPRERREDTTS